MDWDNLKSQVSNLTLYDVKAGVRKVQNAVMNYTEMEAKVREATNNEPWGASSTIMQEIANGTFSYQLLNEIMPMIYKRFTEKSAEEWRQIYKALQLLEFLIKNGSERVIDDARSHLSLLKMLRQFHFIDQNGKDQGINVRNRSKELAELLSDVDRIRSERKKARANRNKFGGVEGGMGLGGSMSSGSRYGGFGSEDGQFGGYSGGVYGDGGGFGGNTSHFSDSQSRRDRFEEYDEYDEGAVAPPGRRKADSTSSPSTVRREAKKAEPPKPKEPEVDLFDFGDDEPTSSSNGKAPATLAMPAAAPAGDDDDFDDFQSASTPATQAPPKPATSFSAPIAPPASTSTTTSSTQFAAPQPRSGAQQGNINDLFASISPPASTTPASTSAFSPPPAQPMQSMAQPFKAATPSGYQPSQPNYFTSVQAGQSQAQPSAASTPSVMSPGSGMGSGMKIGSKPAAPKKAGGDAFGDLLSGTGFKKAGTPTQKGPSMADMAKQKTSAGLWGAPAASTSTPTPPAGGAAAAPKTGSSGLDDLLG